MRRSFSCETVLAADRAEKNSSSVSWTKATIWKSEQAEAGGLAEGRVLGEADRRLPGGDADDPEEAEGGDAGGVVLVPAGDGQELAVEDRPEHAHSSAPNESEPSTYRPAGRGQGAAAASTINPDERRGRRRTRV